MEGSELEIMGHDASIVERQTRAEINQMIATAKQYPREIARCIDGAKAIIEGDKKIAEACGYAKPVAGRKVTGPSVRLAEIAVYSWGNIRAEARMVEDGGDFITCQAQCVDLEKNVGVRIEVRRRAIDKNGQRYETHVLENAANAGNAIAFRNAVFKVIPASIIQGLYAHALEVAGGSADELPDRRKKAIAYFGERGLEKAALLRHLGRKEEMMVTRDDVIYLLGLVESIKSGEFEVAQMRRLDQYGEVIGGIDNEAPDGNGAGGDLKKAAEDKKSAKPKPKDEAEAEKKPVEEREPETDLPWENQGDDEEAGEEQLF